MSPRRNGVLKPWKKEVFRASFGVRRNNELLRDKGALLELLEKEVEGNTKAPSIMANMATGDEEYSVQVLKWPLIAAQPLRPRDDQAGRCHSVGLRCVVHVAGLGAAVQTIEHYAVVVNSVPPTNGTVLARLL